MVQADSGPTPPRGGSRRSQRAYEATIEATLQLLAEAGYHEVTIEGIAARAGVGKATIYRWWPSKAVLVLDAMIASLPEVDYRTTDSVRDDLHWRMQLSNRRFSLDGTAMMALLADLWHSSPDLLDKYRTDYLGPQRLSMRRDLHRAIEGGLLPEDADLDLIMDVWTGTVIFHSLLSGRSEPHLGRWLVDAMLTAPPRLAAGAASPPSEPVDGGAPSPETDEEHANTQELGSGPS